MIRKNLTKNSKKNKDKSFKTTRKHRGGFPIGGPSSSIGIEVGNKEGNFTDNDYKFKICQNIYNIMNSGNVTAESLMEDLSNLEENLGTITFTNIKGEEESAPLTGKALFNILYGNNFEMGTNLESNNFLIAQKKSVMFDKQYFDNVEQNIIDCEKIPIFSKGIESQLPSPIEVTATDLEEVTPPEEEEEEEEEDLEEVENWIETNISTPGSIMGDKEIKEYAIKMVNTEPFLSDRSPIDPVYQKIFLEKLLPIAQNNKKAVSRIKIKIGSLENIINTQKKQEEFFKSADFKTGISLGEDSRLESEEVKRRNAISIFSGGKQKGGKPMGTRSRNKKAIEKNTLINDNRPNPYWNRAEMSDTDRKDLKTKYSEWSKNVLQYIQLFKGVMDKIKAGEKGMKEYSKIYYYNKEIEAVTPAPSLENLVCNYTPDCTPGLRHQYLSRKPEEKYLLNTFLLQSCSFIKQETREEREDLFNISIPVNAEYDQYYQKEKMTILNGNSQPILAVDAVGAQDAGWDFDFGELLKLFGSGRGSQIGEGADQVIEGISSVIKNIEGKQEPNWDTIQSFKTNLGFNLQLNDFIDLFGNTQKQQLLKALLLNFIVFSDQPERTELFNKFLTKEEQKEYNLEEKFLPLVIESQEEGYIQKEFSYYELLHQSVNKGWKINKNDLPYGFFKIIPDTNGTPIIDIIPLNMAFKSIIDGQSNDFDDVLKNSYEQYKFIYEKNDADVTRAGDDDATKILYNTNKDALKKIRDDFEPYGETTGDDTHKTFKNKLRSNLTKRIKIIINKIVEKLTTEKSLEVSNVKDSKQYYITKTDIEDSVQGGRGELIRSGSPATEWAYGEYKNTDGIKYNKFEIQRTKYETIIDYIPSELKFSLINKVPLDLYSRDVWNTDKKKEEKICYNLEHGWVAKTEKKFTELWRNQMIKAKQNFNKTFSEKQSPYTQLINSKDNPIIVKNEFVKENTDIYLNNPVMNQIQDILEKQGQTEASRKYNNPDLHSISGVLSALAYSQSDVLKKFSDKSYEIIKGFSGIKGLKLLNMYDPDPDSPVCGKTKGDERDFLFYRVSVWYYKQEGIEEGIEEGENDRLNFIICYRGSAGFRDFATIDKDIAYGFGDQTFRSQSVYLNILQEIKTDIKCHLLLRDPNFIYNHTHDYKQEWVKKYTNANTKDPCYVGDRIGNPSTKDFRTTIQIEGGEESERNVDIKFYSTGHSLGGFLALITSHASLRNGDWFGNEYTVNGINYNSDKHYSIRNYIRPIVFNPYLGSQTETLNFVKSLPEGEVFRITDLGFFCSSELEGGPGKSYGKQGLLNAGDCAALNFLFGLNLKKKYGCLNGEDNLSVLQKDIKELVKPLKSKADWANGNEKIMKELSSLIDLSLKILGDEKENEVIKDVILAIKRMIDKPSLFNVGNNVLDVVASMFRENWSKFSIGTKGVVGGSVFGILYFISQSVIYVVIALGIVVACYIAGKALDSVSYLVTKLVQQSESATEEAKEILFEEKQDEKLTIPLETSLSKVEDWKERMLLVFHILTDSFLVKKNYLSKQAKLGCDAASSLLDPAFYANKLGGMKLEVYEIENRIEFKEEIDSRFADIAKRLSSIKKLYDMDIMAQLANAHGMDQFVGKDILRKIQNIESDFQCYVKFDGDFEKCRYESGNQGLQKNVTNIEEVIHSLSEGEKKKDDKEEKKKRHKEAVNCIVKSWSRRIDDNNDPSVYLLPLKCSPSSESFGFNTQKVIDKPNSSDTDYELLYGDELKKNYNWLNLIDTWSYGYVSNKYLNSFNKTDMRELQTLDKVLEFLPNEAERDDIKEGWEQYQDDFDEQGSMLPDVESEEYAMRELQKNTAAMFINNKPRIDKDGDNIMYTFEITNTNSVTEFLKKWIRPGVGYAGAEFNICMKKNGEEVGKDYKINLVEERLYFSVPVKDLSFQDYRLSISREFKLKSDSWMNSLAGYNSKIEDILTSNSYWENGKGYECQIFGNKMAHFINYDDCHKSSIPLFLDYIDSKNPKDKQDLFDKTGAESYRNLSELLLKKLKEKMETLKSEEELSIDIYVDGNLAETKTFPSEVFKSKEQVIEVLEEICQEIIQRGSSRKSKKSRRYLSIRKLSRKNKLNSNKKSKKNKKIRVKLSRNAKV
jgi:hypothetical protein